MNARMFEIVFDYDDGWNDVRNIVEFYEGTWRGLQAYIRRMRENGCYNITATEVRC